MHQDPAAAFHAAQDQAFALGALQHQQPAPTNELEQFTKVGKDGRPVRKADEPNDEDEMSEFEITDSEDEAAAINEQRPQAKKRMKKMSRSEQKAVKDKRGARKQEATKVQAKAK